jgi:hypothetical protein
VGVRAGLARFCCSRDFRCAEFTDYGNGTEEFLDDRASIEEFGTVTRVVFARYRRCGSCVERAAIVRLIIPTELRRAMAHRLMAGTANTHSSTAVEAAQLH